MIPILGLIPLFLSISTFVYDYYSDIELTLEYYNGSTFSRGDADSVYRRIISGLLRDKNPCEEGQYPLYEEAGGEEGRKVICKFVEESMGSECYDIKRTPQEYRTAFITNIISISLPVLIFYAMCARLVTYNFNISFIGILQHQLCFQRASSIPPPP